MKTTRWSLLLAGLASMAGGCQPEEPVQAPSAALESQKSALTAGAWTSNASSRVSHPAGHTATLLSGPGDVLVADGNGSEVYNPYTNAWRSTPSMTTGRYFHTATELPSGKVLALGGRTGDWLTLFSSAELYDTATDTWSPTSPMTTARAHHTSVLLDSGKVLVVGGNMLMNRGGPVGSTTELYDPDTGTSSIPSGQFSPRSRAAATVLYSGKVLVTGGYPWLTNPSGASSEVNIYDPATNSWSFAGLLSQARHGHFALRLYSGHVLIVGGIGGGNTVELYDPYTGLISLGPPLPFNASPFFSATMLYSGEVLVTDAIGQAALYDPSTSSWIPTPNMNTGRTAPSATMLHTGQVLFVGGDSDSPRSVERYTR
ncbi:Kelch repeat-containing protein [Archangium lansingense]|uniref:Kelch repeat-containing protein n=1 Tax=Archangium lansingense TaxID=2995310 RepID=UPI003B7DE116